MSRWKLFGVVTIALGFAFFAAGTRALQAVIHTGLPDSTSETTRDLISGSLQGLGLWFIVGWTRYMVYLGRRMQLRDGSRSADSTPTVLYLRSFIADEKAPQIAGAPTGPSFEQRFVTVLSKLGPVVAIGQPNETLPPLGARRIYATDAEWQQVVSELMQRAIAVILRAGETPGLRLEVEMLVRQADPQRALIVTRGVSDEQYRAFVGQTGHLFPRGLPPERGDMLWLAFASDWSPQPLVLAKWKRLLGQTSRSYAGIAESLRPFCSRLGINLGRADTRMSALLSPLMILVLVGILGFAVWRSREPVLHDLHVAIRNPVLRSEKGKFSVTLPSGWDQMLPEVTARIPEDGAADRLMAMHAKFGYGGFGVFVRIEQLRGNGTADEFAQSVQEEFEGKGSTTLQAPVPRKVGAWDGRELIESAPSGFRHLVLTFEAGEDVYYYVDCWTRPEFLDHQTEVYKLAESIKPTP
jgi:hypothetical protein